MELQNNLNGFSEYLFQPAYTPQPTDRSMGFELEFITDYTQQVVNSAWENGFTEDEIEVETNGRPGEGITEIKSHPVGLGNDSFVLERLNDTLYQFKRTVDEVGANLTLGPYDPNTGHTAGIHINISGTDDEDLMRVAKIMEFYKPTMILTSNSDNRGRVEAFGYKNETAIAYDSTDKSRKKRSDILIKKDENLVELRITPMSYSFETSLSVPFVLQRLISFTEGDELEMAKIEYLTNNRPDGDLTYTQINRDRVIDGGFNTQVWDADVLIDGELKIVPYERPVNDFINEHLTRVGYSQQFD